MGRMTPEQKFFDNRSLVPFIARRLFRGLHIEFEDAVAWGHLGLWQACQKDHPVWEAYVRVRIAGAIKDGARVLHRRVKVNESSYEARFPTIVSYKDNIFDNLQRFEWPDEAPSYTQLNQALAELPNREVEILRRSFVKEEKLKDIAAEFGISEARISQIRKRVLLKVRKRLKELGASLSQPPPSSP